MKSENNATNMKLFKYLTDITRMELLLENYKNITTKKKLKTNQALYCSITNINY